MDNEPLRARHRHVQGSTIAFYAGKIQAADRVRTRDQMRDAVKLANSLASLAGDLEDLYAEVDIPPFRTRHTALWEAE